MPLGSDVAAFLFQFFPLTINLRPFVMQRFLQVGMSFDLRLAGPGVLFDQMP